MRSSKPIEGLMADERLLTRVKIEDYLLVHLGLRPCSQTTLPAELPDGKAFGETIDERVYPYLSWVAEVTDPRKKRAAIDAVKRELRAAFKEIVEASDQYQVHLKWAEALGLRSLRFEVRPTVQELYIFRNRDAGKRLRRLMKERGKLRRQTIRRPSHTLGRIQIAYPEEFHGVWLREMGELLGYPGCCVDRYASDREQGVSVEARAAEQIREAGQHWVVDPLAYFISYFFPCAPDCEAALSQGRECHKRLRKISPDLGDLYLSVVAENLDSVHRQPEIIAEYRIRAEKASRRSSEH